MPLQAAFAARRSQKSSKRPLSRQQRRAMMALPPARLKQRTRRQSPSLGRRRSRRFPRLGNGRAGRPEPVADAPSAPSVPTSPCPPFGKAKRAVIRLPTSVHDDLVRRRRRGGDLGSVVPHDVPVLRHVRALLLHLLVGRAVPGCSRSAGRPRPRAWRPVDHVVPTTVRMTAVAAIQVCRFCRSMPCARLFSLLRETAPSPTASGGSGRRPALRLRGRRGRPGPGGRQARRAVAGRPRRPPPAGATTPAIASRSLLFEQIPSVFEQVASAALVTSSPGRGARQLARRRPCFPELQVELSGARRVAVAAAAVGEGSGGNRRRDSACVPRCATTSRCRRPRTPGVVGDSDEDGATLVSG